MAAPTFQTNPVSLRFLLACIHERKLALPDFQRDFVWEPKAVVSLLGSLAENYPAGSLLFLKTAEDYLFDERGVEGAPELDGVRPDELILDGQQRLTSLYGALYGVHSHRFFLKVGELIENKPFEECLLFHPKKHQCGLDQLSLQIKTLTFPLDQLLPDNGYLGWVNEVFKVKAREDIDSALALQTTLQSDAMRAISPVSDYAFPVVTLPSTTTPDAVCRIFSTINSTGVRLTVFDLLAAKVWANEVRLRTWWLEARNEHAVLDEFLSGDGYAILQTIAIRAGKRCTQAAILSLSAEDFETHWASVVDDFAQALGFLRRECGVASPKYLPAGPALVSLASTWDLVSAAKGPKRGEMRDKLKRWFWCASFGSRYDQGANSKIVRDAKDLRIWLGGGAAPKVVTTWSFKPADLEFVNSPNASIYKAVLAMTLENGARDFHTGDKIADDALTSDVHDHHVFPKKSAAAADLDPSRVNSVLNRALIDGNTNIRINNQCPSSYLHAIRKHISSLDDILTSHFLPSGSESPLEADDFDAFLSWRVSEIGRSIELKTGWAFRARERALAILDSLRSKLSSLTVEECTDSEDGYVGIDVSSDATERTIWIGVEDNCRMQFGESQYMWCYICEGASEPSSAENRFRRLLGDQESKTDDEGYRYFAVTQTDSALIAKAVLDYLS